MPEFDTWTNQSLVLFAYEAHRRMCEQEDTIKALRADVKMLLEAFRKETIDETSKNDARGLRAIHP